MSKQKLTVFRYKCSECGNTKAHHAVDPKFPDPPEWWREIAIADRQIDYSDADGWVSNPECNSKPAIKRMLTNFPDLIPIKVYHFCLYCWSDILVSAEGANLKNILQTWWSGDAEVIQMKGNNETTTFNYTGNPIEKFRGEVL